MSKEHQEEQDRLRCALYRDVHTFLTRLPQEHYLLISYRKQEEETLKMAIELSKSEASNGATDDSHNNNPLGDNSTGVLGM